MNERELWEAAWWSAVAEPGDPCARVVRRIFGDRGAREWLQSRWTGVPEQLAVHQRIDWRTQWNRWRERALLVDIDADLDRVARSGGGFLVPSDPRWPEQLACLGEDEPMGLWLREQGSISLLSALEPPREQEIDVPETWRHSSPLLE